MRVTTKDSVGPALVKFYQESGFLFSKKQKKKIQKISEFIYFDVWGDGKTEILIGEEKASDGKNIASLKVVFEIAGQRPHLVLEPGVLIGAINDLPRAQNLHLKHGRHVTRVDEVHIPAQGSRQSHRYVQQREAVDMLRGVVGQQ